MLNLKFSKKAAKFLENCSDDLYNTITNKNLLIADIGERDKIYDYSQRL
ncbi:hypothetical protein J4221_05475 [Candidatus Pacearchaeota archaeon]|nr:hypothetical protein [Candidatus Pacearchaeota archaeon]